MGCLQRLDIKNKDVFEILAGNEFAVYHGVWKGL